jgi:serine/alanine adding enzyme
MPKRLNKHWYRRLFRWRDKSESEMRHMEQSIDRQFSGNQGGSESGPITVRPYSGSGKEWDAYVDSNPDATLYHLHSWRHVLSESLGHESTYLAAYQGERIVGIAPLVLVKSRIFGVSLSSMPFLNYGGVCADTPEAQSALYTAAIDLAKGHQANYLEFRNVRQPSDSHPIKLEKATYILPLAATEEETFAAFRKATRNRIRKVDEHKLEMTRGRDIVKEFYRGFAIAMKEHGTPVLPKSFFEAVRKHFGDMVCFYVASKDGDPAGVKLTITWRDTMFHIWGGYPSKHKTRLANYLVSWEATRDAIKAGLKQCDFGRSTKESGPADFKRHFGCQEFQLYWEYPYLATGSLPSLNPSNKKYQMAIAVWSKLPLPITTLLGPRLSRFIP